MTLFKGVDSGTSLVVQWLRLHASNTGGLGLIPGQETRSHMKQPGVHMPQLKNNLHAATKTQPSQINSFFFFFCSEFCRTLK